MEIWKLNNNKWRHGDVVTKNNGKIRTSAKPNKLYITRNVLTTAIQKCTFYWIWATVSRVTGHFCHILAFFHQIWSCQVTQNANFEKFLFCPNSILNIGKSHKISSGKAFYYRSYQPKILTPQCRAFRVKRGNTVNIHTFIILTLHCHGT